GVAVDHIDYFRAPRRRLADRLVDRSGHRNRMAGDLRRHCAAGSRLSVQRHRSLYLEAGGYLLSRPALGASGLTLVLGIFLFAEGVTDVVAYFSTRKSGNSGWMLLDGVVTLILSFMIWNHWPLDSLWVVGTLVGVSMVMTGTT